jgi:D-arabinose 1-dehydrogenase-like Zn-dependent alcohol dehydrogenase
MQSGSKAARFHGSVSSSVAGTLMDGGATALNRSSGPAPRSYDLRMSSASHGSPNLIVSSNRVEIPNQLSCTFPAISGGGAHGVLVTAVSPPAFSQAIQLLRRKGTVAMVGLPPGEFQTPIFDVVLKRITLRGSIVGTRRDLAEAVASAAEGKARAHIHKVKLSDINNVFDDLKAGTVDGRIVIDL